MNTNNHSAKFAFFYLLSLMALVFTSLSVGMIVFQIINKYIPDPIGRFGQDFSLDLLRFAISALVVAAPTFFLTSQRIYKNLLNGTLAKEAAVRKWLTYFILLISSFIILGWLIGLINSYLAGELTIKFVLKALTSIVISSIAFTFYLYDIRRDKVNQKNNIIRAYFYGSLAIVAAIFTFSLLIVESPSQARDRKMDNAILEDFNTISSGLNGYYREKQELPPTLEDLKLAALFVDEENLKDPETGRLYEYKIVGDRKYELCAVFRTSNVDGRLDTNDQFYREQWPHKEGPQCLFQVLNEVPASVKF